MITTIPYSDKIIEKYYNQETDDTLVVDYNKSEYKGESFLWYIYNFGIKCDISFENIKPDDIKELLTTYINLGVKDIDFDIPSLRDTFLKIIFTKKGIKNHIVSLLADIDIQNYIEEHDELLNNSIIFLDSIFLAILQQFNLSDIDYSDYEIIDGEDTSVPHNIITLLHNPLFFDNFSKVGTIKYYKRYFEDPIYDNYNIAYYLMNENNFISQFLLGIGMNEISENMIQKFLGVSDGSYNQTDTEM